MFWFHEELDSPRWLYLYAAISMQITLMLNQEGSGFKRYGKRSNQKKKQESGHGVMPGRDNEKVLPHRGILKFLHSMRSVGSIQHG